MRDRFGALFVPDGARSYVTRLAVRGACGDLTRFWNRKDSPLQITPADIAPVSTASRAQNVDTTAAGMGVSQAKFTPLVAMPDPAALHAAQATTTANLFRDMSGLNTMSQVLTKGLEAAAGNDKDAGARVGDRVSRGITTLVLCVMVAVQAVTQTRVESA
ncbi:hypothetical protein ACWGR4_22650 [Embleya sp. NPDC055664]